MSGAPSLDVAHLAEAIRWWMWVAVALLLVIARFLPVSLPRRGVAVIACASLVIAALGLTAIVRTLGEQPRIERKGTFDAMIAELERSYQPGRPTVLVIGSSRSTLGLDGAAFERQLAVGLGRDVQVLQFTATGHYALEQLYTTRKLLTRIHPQRLTVLVELGSELDIGLPEVLLNTTRGIEFFDAHTFAVNLRMWRAARSGNADDPAYSKRQLLRALSHTVMHHLGIGLLFDLEPASRAGIQKGFVPTDKPYYDNAVPDARAALLESSTPVNPPSDRGELVSIARTEIVEDLAGRVPELRVVFFFPPTASVDMRATARIACEGVAHLGPCLRMTDDEIRERLPAEKWADPHHLATPGASAFTDWLAASVVATLLAHSQSAN